MKKKLFFISALLSLGLSAFNQEVQLLPAVIPSGGDVISSQAVNLSWWRIGETHVVTIPADQYFFKQEEVIASNLVDDWSVFVYPNPVKSRLKIQFNTKSPGEFALEITDISGKKLIVEKARHILPGQTEELDLTRFGPAIYLLKIIPSDEEFQKLIKITKQ